MSENKRLIDFLEPHMVAIAWIDTDEDGANAESFLVTGFVVLLDEYWMVAVAGHVLADMKKRFANGRKPKLFRLYDSWQLDPCDRNDGIPIDLQHTPTFAIDDESRSLDYGLVPIGPLHRAAMEKANVVPLEQHLWRNVPDDCEAYLLLGFPKMLHKKRERIEGATTTCLMDVALTSAPVERLAPCDVPNSLKVGFSRFYGRIGENFAPEEKYYEKLHDIDGFSGGPLFGFKRVDGKWRYWLVGIQSTWLKSQRIICACPFADFANCVASELSKTKMALMIYAD